MEAANPQDSSITIPAILTDNAPVHSRYNRRANYSRSRANPQDGIAPLADDNSVLDYYNVSGEGYHNYVNNNSVVMAPRDIENMKWTDMKVYIAIRFIIYNEKDTAGRSSVHIAHGHGKNVPDSLFSDIKRGMM